MLMDKVTEIVSHMIGIFETTLENERLRDAYDKFKAIKPQEPDLEAPKTVDVTFTAKHTLIDFTPDVNYAPPLANTLGPDAVQLQSYGGYFPLLTPLAEMAVPNTLPPAFQMWSTAGRPLLTLEPPSSVVTVTYQTNVLSDNDVFRSGEGTMDFTDPAILLAQLDDAAGIATAIASPADIEMVGFGDTAQVDAAALRDHVAAVDALPLSGVVTTVLHGMDALGVHVNGQAVDEMPTLDALMPAFMTDDKDEVPEDSDAHVFPDPFEGMDQGVSNNVPEIEDGHSVVTGANTLVNEVSIATAWLDAAVIAVMGDVFHIDAVSQVNVMIDHDTGIHGIATDSNAINAAVFGATTSNVPVEDQPADTDGEFPFNWAVTRIEGDLINVNQVTQYTFQTDNDFAEITFESANTYIGLGDNTVINLTSLSELGYGYDLIICGGAMISINWINQINVMIDNDALSFSGTPPTTMSGGDNLLFNGAMINSVGLDTYVDLQANFEAAGADFANGAVTIDENIAHDSVFEGIDILRVLYVDGDFTSINWIEQTNVLGDSDEVHLALEEFQAQTGGAVNVTSGSNLVVNVAAINDYGTDSTIMVGGDVYDDALLYQAELIDTDADPLGVGMPALATEAVAFLADDMMTADAGPVQDTITPTPTENMSSPDMMQTMLA